MGGHVDVPPYRSTGKIIQHNRWLENAHVSMFKNESSETLSHYHTSNFEAWIKITVKSLCSRIIIRLLFLTPAVVSKTTLREVTLKNKELEQEYISEACQINTT